MTVECVDPSYVIVPNTGIFVLMVPVVLAWETVIMRVQSLDHPPIPLDRGYISEVFLSIIFRHLAVAIIWHLIFTLIVENAI